LLHVDTVRLASQEAIEKWTIDLETNMPEEIAEKIKNADCPCLYGLLESKNHEDRLALQQFVVTEQTAVTPPGNAVGVRVGCCLDDDESSRQKSEFQAIWNGFLRLYNLFQFLPLAFFVTTEGVNKKAYDGIKLFDETIPAGVEPPGEPEKESWDEIREMTDENLHGLLDVLRNNDWLVPEAGYELADLDGEIIASAELAWEELKIAFLLDEELEYESRFVEAGWQIYPMKDVLENPDNYLSMNKK